MVITTDSLPPTKTQPCNVYNDTTDTIMNDDDDNNINNDNPSDVVVGVNPLSSQAARMAELNQLKHRGLTRQKSLNLSPSENFADVNSFYTSQKSLRDSHKKQQLESMQYLHKYQNNEVTPAQRKWRSDSLRRVGSAHSFSSLPLSPSSSGMVTPERRDSPERALEEECEFPTLPVLAHNLSVVESVSMKSSSSESSSSSVEMEENQTNEIDECHAHVIEDEEEEVEITEECLGIEEEEILNDVTMTEQQECPTEEAEAEMEDEEMEEETEDEPEPSSTKEEMVMVDGTEHGTFSPPEIEADRIEEPESSMVSEEEVEEPPREIVTDDHKSTSPREVNFNTYTKPDDTYTSENKRPLPRRRKTTNSTSPTNRPSNPKPKTPNRQSRRTKRTTQPRFRNMVSPNSDREPSSESIGSCPSSKSGLSSQISFDSSVENDTTKVTKTRPQSVKQRETSKGSRSSVRAARTLHSREPRRSTAPSKGTTTNTRTTTTPRTTSITRSSSLITVPMYPPSLLKRGIRKNSKRTLSPTELCHQKWEPKAHESLAGCERCLGFANKKELDAYTTRGHHHSVMMTRGGCGRDCKLFPRKEGESCCRMCQRCFHDTHMGKLW